MKTLSWLLLLALLGLGLYAYLEPDLLKRTGETARKLTGTAPAATTYYKWRDPAGQWQLSDRPPAQGIPYETVEVSRDQNVLPLPPQLEDR